MTDRFNELPPEIKRLMLDAFTQKVMDAHEDVFNNTKDLIDQHDPLPLMLGMFDVAADMASAYYVEVSLRKGEPFEVFAERVLNGVRLRVEQGVAALAVKEVANG